MDREAKRTLGWVANALLVSVMVGNPCADAQARYERMADPQPGDLIFEVSTLHYLLRDLSDPRWDGQFVRLKYIGIWYEEIPGEEAVEQLVYICQSDDGSEYRWLVSQNSSPRIYSIPDGPGWAIPIGAVDFR